MMHNFPLEYSELWLASSSLNTRQSKLLIDLLARYTQASAVNPDAQFPETDDVKVGAVLYPICMRIQACTVKHAKRSKTNKCNADARWNKGKDDQATGNGKSKAAKDKAEAKAVKQDAPMTLEEFKDFVGDGHDTNDVKQLYDKLQGMGWVYHGHQLSEYWTKCNKCYERHGSKYCCGLYAVVAYNTERGRKEPFRAAVFNALCDMAAASGRDLCDVGAILASTRTMDDRIVYARETFDSIEKYINAFKTSEN